MFIGRQRELNSLNNFYNKDGTGMMVITGRRRIGKSTLISEFVKDKKTIPAIGHSWGVAKVTKKATLTTNGVLTYTCLHNAVHKKTSAIPKLALTAKAAKSSFKIKSAKVKKAKQTIKSPVKVTGAKTTVTYAKNSGKGNFTVNKTTGDISVKKKTKAGTYTVKVKVTTAANAQYAAASKEVKVKIVVK